MAPLEPAGFSYGEVPQFDEWDGEADVSTGVIPVLAGEMFSPTTEEIDLKDKAGIYRDAGIPEGWIFDRRGKPPRSRRFAENPGNPVARMGFDNTRTRPLLSGFSMETPKIRRAPAIGRKGRPAASA